MMLLGPPRWNESQRDNTLRRTSEILRGPTDWSLDLTNRCVGRCLHCFNRSTTLPRNEMDDDQILKLVDELIGIQPMGLCLCGGEPLLRLDLACQVMERLSDAGTKVNMVTTGLTLTQEVAKRLKESGINSVQVSLDGATAESHEHLRRLPGGFAGAIRALQCLADAGVETGIAFSPTRFNIGELERVVELASELGAQEVRMQPLMPMGEGLLNWHEIAPTAAQYDALIAWYRQVCLQTRPRLSWGDPVDHMIRFGQFNDEGVCHNVAISSDGYLTPSPYLPLFVGRVGRHSLSDYWHAGLARIWDLRLVRELAFRVRSVEDLGRLSPIPFLEPPILIDLIDDPPARIEHVTELVLRLNRSVDTLATQNVMLSQ
jgi:MoaA/NifB/PqqE/SkfB family radical SAM enzyme